jgi:hypothetical protein
MKIKLGGWEAGGKPEVGGQRSAKEYGAKGIEQRVKDRGQRME